MIRNKITYITPLLLMAMMTDSAYALRANYSIGASIGRYSNINLENDPQGYETTRSVFGTISVTENTANLIANANGRVEYVDYLKNTNEDNVVGKFVGDALWTIKPDQFQWYVADVYTQTTVNVFKGGSQQNSENANAFLTGPNYFLRFGPRSKLAVEARYERYDFEDSSLRNQRYTGVARLLYDVTSDLIAGINYEHENTDYKEEGPGFVDATRKDAYLSLNYKHEADSVKVEAGRTEIREDSGQFDEADRYAFHLSTQRTKTSTFQFGYTELLTDSSTDLLSLLNDPLELDNDLSLATGPYLDKTTYGRYIKRGAQLGFDVKLYKTTQDYLRQEELNQEIKGINTRITYQLDNGDRLLLAGDLRKTNYIYFAPVREDKDSLYSLEYTRTLRRRLNFISTLQKETRHSSVDTDSYVDKRIILTLEYTTR